MKKFAIFIIGIGTLLIAFGTYELVQSNLYQNQALAEANSIISQSGKVNKSNLNFTSTELLAEFNPLIGETVGILHIPKLEADLPIIEGTDPDELERGVGHYRGTAYPLQQNQIVLSGHRETVFRRMGELVLGDILVIKLPYGEFSYEIVATNVVDADDRTIIQPTSPNEVLTLTTCYPFNFIGNAPERYIITAHPINED